MFYRHQEFKIRELIVLAALQTLCAIIRPILKIMTKRHYR